MELTHLITFNLALLAAMLSPGPAFLIAVQASLSAGRGAGVATGVGLASVAAMWTAAALLGLDVVFALFPWAYVVVKSVGAAYLLFIAWGMWRDASAPLSNATLPPGGAFRRGMLVNILNPKSVLFAGAVLVVIFPSGMTTGQNLLIIANHFLAEVAFYSLLAVTMSRPRVRDGYLAAKRHLDRLAAVVLGGLGLRLLISR